MLNTSLLKMFKCQPFNPGLTKRTLVSPSFMYIRKPFPSWQIRLCFAFVLSLESYPFEINPSPIYHLQIWYSSGTPEEKRYRSQAVRLRRLKEIFVTEAALWSANTLRATVSFEQQQRRLHYRVEKIQSTSGLLSSSRNPAFLISDTHVHLIHECTYCIYTVLRISSRSNTLRLTTTFIY